MLLEKRPSRSEADGWLARPDELGAMGGLPALVPEVADKLATARGTRRSGVVVAQIGAGEMLILGGN